MIDAADEDDADEIRMNENRLKKTFADLKICNQSMLLAQGATAESQDASFQFSILENKELENTFKVDVIKKGKLTDKAIQKPQEEEAKASAAPKNPRTIEKAGDNQVDLSSDDDVMMHDQ